MKLPQVLVLTLFLFLSISHTQAAMKATCASRHVLVRFKPEVRDLLPTAARPEQLAALLQQLDLPAAAELHESSLAQALRQKRNSVSSQPQTQLDLDRFFYLRLPPGLAVDACVHRLEQHPLIDYVEPDGIGTCAVTIPDDPNFAHQWHHQNTVKPSASIQTPQAWDITEGSSNVLVAVLDTGLADLPEFAGRTVPGFNFAYTNTETLDDNGHGTQVAGLLCASANNATLGAGVDWYCRIMPVKVFDSNNSGFYSWWAQAIDFAVSNGCKVINLSGAGTEFGRTVQRAITNAIARGVVFVTAAGNLGATNLSFPGYLNVCITVGATDREDRRAPFSNSGPQLDLVAPGQEVMTVGASGEMQSVRGTSFSAPLVAGVCALLAAVRPTLNQAEARQLLCAAADDQVGDATDTPGFDNYYGWGRLNAFHTLLLATTRIDHIRSADGMMELSWPSPPNAPARQPYLIEYKSSLASDWIPITDTNGFHYATNRTSWIDDGTRTGGMAEARFYRIGLRSF
jgi:subtilisin family serine protease